MFDLGALIRAWFAVHIYVGFYYGILFARQRRGVEHLWLAIVSFALALYTWGAAQLFDATDLDSSIHARQVQWIGATVAVGAGVTFMQELLGNSRARATSIAMGWTLLVFIATFADLLFERKGLPTNAFVLIPFDKEYIVPAMSPVGWALSAIGTGLTAHSVFGLGRRARTNRDLRLIVFAMIPLFLAAGHDIAMRIIGFRSMYLTEHAVLISLILVSYVIMQRLVRTADELTMRTQELGNAHHELRQMQEELVRKEQLAAVGELSAVIAHEVRNPLAVLKNASSGLRRVGSEEDEASVLLQIIDEEVNRLNRLIRDLLTYARPVSPQITRLSLRSVIAHAVELVRRADPRNVGVDVELRLASAPTEVDGDRDLLERALINVTENAMEAMGGDGSFLIETSVTALEGGIPAIAIACRDTGEGMDTQVRKKARDLFFTTRPSGIGLGLAIVERVARAHGGRIDIQSTRQSGTTVTLILPIERPRLKSDRF